MEISKSFNRYDSTVQQPTNSTQPQALATKNSVKSFQEAYKVDISEKALASADFNDPTISFPVHDEDVLQYSQNLSLSYKPY